MPILGPQSPERPPTLYIAVGPSSPWLSLFSKFDPLSSIVGSANSTWFDAYHSYADHVQFLKDLQATYPANSEIVVAGNSLQGRSIIGIHLYGEGGKGSKPAVVFHGTVHAREWITTMVRTTTLEWRKAMLITYDRSLNTLHTTS